MAPSPAQGGALAHLDACGSTLAEPTWDPFAGPSLRRIAFAALITVGFGFGGLGAWAALTPLDSAVPAAGVFVAAGKRKTVTLLDSGILKQLLVAEGNRVEAGQALLLLDDTQIRATRNQAKAQYWGAVAKAARAEAERADQHEIVFQDGLLSAAADPDISLLLEAERGLFTSRWATFDTSVRIGARKIDQLEAQTAAIQVQIRSLNTRLSLMNEEARGVEILLKDGFAPKTRALEMRRGIAELQGALGDAAGRLLEAHHSIEQTKLEIANLARTRHSEASKELQDARAVMVDADQRLQASEKLLARQSITAPESGTVTDIKFFTSGSSIPASQPILDIVPGDSKLLIEAQVTPMEIEHVRVGLHVNVRLTAYKVHKVPTLTGKVVYVGADAQQDAHGEPIFLIRAELGPDVLKPFPEVTVNAGMPADVLIIGGERTVLDFLISPIRDGIRHGMREE